MHSGSGVGLPKVSFFSLRMGWNETRIGGKRGQNEA